MKFIINYKLSHCHELIFKFLYRPVTERDTFPDFGLGSVFPREHVLIFFISFHFRLVWVGTRMLKEARMMMTRMTRRRMTRMKSKGKDNSLVFGK